MGGKAPLTEQFSSRSHQKKEKRDIRMDIERPVGNLLRLTRLPPRKRRSNVSTSHPEEQSSREQFDSLHRSPTKQKTPPRLVVFFVGDPWENRTPVSALRGPCLSRLTNGPYHLLNFLDYVEVGESATRGLSAKHVPCSTN